MAEEKKQYQDQPVEKSLSFISYNLKQINATLQAMAALMEESNKIKEKASKVELF